MTRKKWGGGDAVDKSVHSAQQRRWEISHQHFFPSEINIIGFSPEKIIFCCTHTCTAHKRMIHHRVLTIRTHTHRHTHTNAITYLIFSASAHGFGDMAVSLICKADDDGMKRELVWAERRKETSNKSRASRMLWEICLSVGFKMTIYVCE